MFSLLTLVGLNLGVLIGGAVLIEEIFAIPGMGQELIQAVQVGDVITVEAIVVVIALAVVVMSILTDLLCAVLETVRKVSADK
jgi:peptide/nickel transport system permease protein